MKFSIITLFAYLATPAVARISGITVGDKKADDGLRKLIASNDNMIDNSPSLEERAAMDGLAKRINVGKAGRLLQTMEEHIYEDELQTISTKASQLAIREVGRKLQSTVYEDKLGAIVSQVNQFTADDAGRNLKTIDEPADDLKAVASQVQGRTGRDLQLEDGAYRNQCILDTDALIKANPLLEQAIDDYITSFDFDQSFDSTTNITYADVFYSEQAETNLGQACAAAGGHLDVNTGWLVCALSSTISMTQRYVSCLADTQECQAKNNFEYLEVALESNDWFCVISTPSMAPSVSPGTLPAPPPASDGAPPNFDQCMSDTNVLIFENPNIFNASVNYINSMDSSSNPITGYITLFYSDEAEENLRQECALAGGYFDEQIGSLTCDLKSDLYSTTTTATMTSHASCLANTPACMLKGNYEHLQWSFEQEGFFNCRTSVGAAATPAPMTNPFVPAPTALPTLAPVPAPTNYPTAAPAFPSTGSCWTDIDIWYYLSSEVYDTTLAYIRSLEYEVDTGYIHYSYSDNELDDLEEACEENGGYFVHETKDSLHCEIDYDGYTIDTETSGYAMCLPPTDDCYDYNIYDFLEETLTEAGYYDCYVD